MRRRQLLQGSMVAWTAGVAGLAHSPLAGAQAADPRVRHLARWLDSIFAWPADAAASPELAALRDRAVALAAAHRERLAPLLPQWVQQARAADPQDPDGDGIWVRLNNRLFNEVAMHDIDHVSAAVDEAWLAALQRPQACRMPPTTSGWWQRRLLPLATLEPALRDVALDGEARLLARWGQQPRDGLPERPAETSKTLIEAEVLQARQDGRRSGLAMPLAGAAAVFDRDPEEPDEWWPDARCVLHRWWLQRELARPGADRRALLDQYRFGSAATALYWIDASKLPPRRADQARAYPPRALRFEVTGDVKVELAVDREGVVRRARVVERKLMVPGIVGRPVAFEDLLDEASVRVFLGSKQSVPPPESFRGDLATTTAFTKWTLE